MKFKANQEVILASTSPRRQELLERLNVPFQAVKSNVIEKNEAFPENVENHVTDLAIQKAKAVAKEHPEKVIIGADTIVSFEGQIFPKPESKEQAKAFLQTLSGETHLVLTAVAIVKDSQVHSFVSETKVTFYDLSPSIIDAYIATDDPYDKAGAYGIQSDGLFFVKEIHGDYYSVMGLPIAQLSKTLLELDVLALVGSVNQG